MRRRSSTKTRTLAVSLLVVLTSCGSLGSPVDVTDRPLSERIDDRNAALLAAEDAPADADAPSFTPEAIAFSETLASGDFLRLNVTTNGVDAPLRSGPGMAYDELTTLPHGAEVLATGNQTGEWVYVVYGDFEGWVSSRRLTIGEVEARDAVVGADQIDTAPVVYLVSGDTIGVNMRAEPNASGALVSGAPLDSQVIGTGKTDGSWIEITFNGVTGWASGNYLKPIGTVGNLPAAAATDE